ncbi:YfbK domain-containing protein [Candidatus Uabimicrobium amorphum]|uniref:VWFA domain-containing protein n=1 Tax=Uabimicrobium amorphum TaxID=2596890 RepID=A0A5S9IUY1_UABAM|nr:von Willebrand factor type A domain-containing protein [Candidatus Uabimicrobium amorphum]BBM88217.1 hypothetical protein UABAM_06638 [Candidatus Uabimicrobium amorphum]
MNCELFHAQVYDYLYELLEEDEKCAFEEHAKSCYQCQEKLEIHRKSIGLLDKWEPEARVVKAENVVKPVAFDLSQTMRLAATLCLITLGSFAVLHWKDIALLISGRDNMVDVQLVEREMEKKYKTHYKELQDQFVKEHNRFLSNKNKENEKLLSTLEKLHKKNAQFKEMLEKLTKQNEQLRNEKLQRDQQVLQDKEEQELLAKLQERLNNLKEKIPLYRPSSAIRKRYEKNLVEIAFKVQKLQEKMARNVVKQKNELEKRLHQLSEVKITKRNFDITRWPIKNNSLYGDVDKKLKEVDEKEQSGHVTNNTKTSSEDFFEKGKKIALHSARNIEENHNSDTPFKAEFNFDKQKMITEEKKEFIETQQIIKEAEKQGVRLDLLQAREKPLNGVVTAISKSLPLIMLSVGSDNDVRKGDQFTIFRDNKYIGEAVVEEVYKEACAARILQRKESIQKGDSVTTRFGGNKDIHKSSHSKNTSNAVDEPNSLFDGSDELLKARDQFLPHLANFYYEKGWGSEEFEELVKKGKIKVEFPQAWQKEIDRKKAREIFDYMAKNTRFNTEAYEHIVENPFVHVMDDPLSTFSIDVDTAAYANMRRFLNNYRLPPKDAVRLEEMINYFEYDYPQPQQDAPFSVHTEMAKCPWNPKNILLKIGLQGRKLEPEKRPASNIVFLVDVSGSMRGKNKIQLLKRSLQLLVAKMNKSDRIAIVVYAGASGLVLPATTCDNKNTILHALNQLQSGGSTNGGQGIELAYKVAQENFIDNGINRVILATDGDFNVGITDRGSLTRLITKKAKSGVFLTVLGFGMGNYKDETLETLADKGNGNYAYIDKIEEAQKVLVKQMHGTLWTIAKDVKIQIEFNPNLVESYRLVGYENRKLQHQDFNDDTKDAGEIGVGHTVTAFYEISPTYNAHFKPKVEALRYQHKAVVLDNKKEMAFIKLRYKKPKEDKSDLVEFSIDKNIIKKPSQDFLFASSVASFGMLLRDSQYKGVLNYDMVLELAKRGAWQSKSTHRQEFITLIQKAQVIHQVTKIQQHK